MKNIIIPPVFVFISLFLIVFFYFMIPEYNLIKFPLNLCGIIIAIIGFAIMGTTSSLFRKHNTTLTYKKSSYLITEGVFAKTRNPMYIGMFLLLLGIGVCFMNLFSILTSFGFILTIHLFCIPVEEKMMHDAFGQDYLDYKNKVRRWI
ncbi:MAG: isoprenylcysteine carboxylmethyltransferase family protein [Bacteroidales bacterium]|nr:isoprenylcysteine carboxylmethyltransferase family protein [Bacteroidales bacterium]